MRVRQLRFFFYFPNEQNQCVEHQSARILPRGFTILQILDQSEIVDYIKVTPLYSSSKEITLVISTILQHLNDYAYLDTYLNPPHC